MSSGGPAQALFPWEGRVLTVKNLSYDVRPTDLRDLFATKGKLLRVDIERDKSGAANGLAYVEFASTADCESAAELHGSQFCGRSLRCQIATHPPPELLRFYIRPPENRPINDRVKERILAELRGDLPEPERPRMRRRPLRSRERRRTRDVIDIDRDDRQNPSSSYSDSYSDERK
jgi:RNA recognition motif-containing protein